MYRSVTTHSKNRTAKISASGVAMGSVVSGHVTMAIPGAEMSALRFFSYTAYVVRSSAVRSAQVATGFLLSFCLIDELGR